MKFDPHRLRQAREARGLSRDEVAPRIGRTVGVVVKHELGTITPSVAVLTRYAEVYGVSLDALFDPNDPTDAVTAFRDELTRLVATAPALSDEQVSELRALLRPGAA